MKKQIVLLSLSAALVASVFGASMFANKGNVLTNNISMNKRNSGSFVLDENTITEEETYYQGVALDDSDNEVNTRFYGMTSSTPGVLEFSGNSIAHFTNVDPMRGVEDITLTLSKPADTESFFYYAIYGSYNPLSYDDIYSGKYSDLTYVSSGVELATASTSYTLQYSHLYGAESLAACRYVFVLIGNNKSTSLTLESLSFDVVCQSEPVEQVIGQSTDYKERSAMTTAGVPNYFPYPGTNGYDISIDSDYTNVSFIVPLSVLSTAFEIVMNEGFEMAYNESMGEETVYYFQKDLNPSGVETIGLMMAYINFDMAYVSMVYTTQAPDMRAPSFDYWPSEEIAKHSSVLASLVPAFNLSNATYKVMSNDSHVIYVAITISDTTHTEDEIDTYLASFNSAIWYDAETDVNRYYIYSKDGNTEIEFDYMGSSIQMTIEDHAVYNYFPATEFNSGKNVGLQIPNINLDGTYSFTSGKIRANFNGEDDFSDFKDAILAEDYFLDGNDNMGCFVPAFGTVNTNSERPMIRYYKVGNNQYLIDISGCASYGDDYSFSQALEILADRFDGSGNPFSSLTAENVRIFEVGSYGRYGYIANEDLSYISTIYASLNATQKTYGSDSIQYVFSGKGEMDNYQVNIVFIEKADGLYFVANIDYISTNTVTGFINQNDLASALTGEYPLPVGNHYINYPDGRISYVGTFEDVATLGKSYQNSLINAGFSHNKLHGYYYSPSNDYRDVIISYQTSMSASSANIIIAVDLQAEDDYVTYAETDLADVSFIDEVEDIFDKVKPMYNYYDKDDKGRFSFYIDADQLVLGEYYLSILDLGFTHQYPTNRAWQASGSNLVRTGNDTKLYTISLGPSSSGGNISRYSTIYVMVEQRNPF